MKSARRVVMQKAISPKKVQLGVRRRGTKAVVQLEDLKATRAQPEKLRVYIVTASVKRSTAKFKRAKSATSSNWMSDPELGNHLERAFRKAVQSAKSRSS